MTSQSPRIYIYKITFEEVYYYYYGVKKEEYYNQVYWGSPYTNKWCWELYTPKKQILQVFPCTDEGWVEAQEVEKRLIQPFYQTDKWCLNENCGGKISLEVSRQVGLRHKENGTGCFSINLEQRKEAHKKAVDTNRKNKTGIFGIRPEQRSQNSKKGIKTQQKLGVGLFGLTEEERSKNSKILYENGIGLGGLTPEEKSEIGKKGYANGLGKLTTEQKIENSRKAGNKNIETGHIIELGKKMAKKHKENKTGIFGLTPEQKTEYSKKGSAKNKENGIAIFALTKEQLSNQGKKTNAQKWECTETGYITNSGALSTYQKARGIDTSKRKRIA